MPTATPETALAVLQQFRLVVSAMQGQYQRMHRQTGLSGAQLWFLQEIASEPGLTLGQVAQRLAIHQSTASNQLEKLVRRGLVLRNKQAVDRRVTRLQLTEAGHAALAASSGPARGLLQQTLLTMPEPELQMLHAALSALGQRLGPWLSEHDAHTPLATLLGQPGQDE
ncbi:MarR family winged helix-turn-helix transcriptional regulator [Chitinolyticbacter meiyuanensis]|uniref:MarR family winged helix-turn-helix transcriptional regulator n=1 Tax=Chitinolyticbacter meiyuanensis TaxID=682798 RepID=UPI0016524598|nr:MarR family winged helix-turn-helix transcriptional regulator [Chitinolyticbacter meiyuanensis]